MRMMEKVNEEREKGEGKKEKGLIWRRMDTN